MEMMDARKKELRDKWSDKLFAFPLSSGMVAHAVVVTSAYLITPHHRSIHLSLPPGSAQWPSRARIVGWDIFDAAAAFFEEKPAAPWVIITMVSVGGDDDQPRSTQVKPVMWWD
jgi:hypothetical protein